MQRMAESRQLEDVPRELAGVAQGQTQRRSNTRRGSNKRKSYTIVFIKKKKNTRSFGFTEIINKSVQHSCKKIKLEIKWEENRGKILAELTMNRTKKNTGDAKHKNKGRGSLRTGPHALINILWLPIFYSPILN